jgi:threonylcarbamoyladenosine tRNA methylthiotransferase MtaB
MVDGMNEELEPRHQPPTPNHRPTYAIVTFGCRVNQADSLVIERDLRARGDVAAPAEQADLLIVNTCSVTANADQAARQTIRRIVKGNPAVKVVVTGCYATRRPDEVGALPNVAQVVSNTDKDNVVEIISRAGLSSRAGLAQQPRDQTTAERFGDGDGACGEMLRPGVGGRTALTLRVQTGCEERCSYCIIPTTRGASRSKPLAAVLGDISLAVAAGYKEIAITGVHLGSYGRDFSAPTSLAALVRALSEWPDDVLFRISSLEPMDCAPEIVEMVAASPRLAPHFHLPLQHGSDEMLRLMRRPYTASFYRGLVERIRDRMPHVSIGSDVIVGFPGETDEHFGETRSLLLDLPLTHLHVFPYSDRPGTEASARQSKVGGIAIRERGRQLRAIGSELARRFRESQTGAMRRALVVDDGRWAVTDNYLKVRLAEQLGRNEFVTVTVPAAPLA